MVAAARRGASVLLAERYGFLGGMATAGLVLPFMRYYSGDQVLTTAVFNELIDRLDKAGGLAPNRHTFDDEVLKVVLDRMMAEARHDLLVMSDSDIRLAPGMLRGVAATLEAKPGVRVLKSGDMQAHDRGRRD